MLFQWLKWFCEAGGGGLTWRSQVGANPIPIPHPTNLALFRHKITLYRFNQGAHTIAGGLKWEQGAEPPEPPHFNHCVVLCCCSVFLDPRVHRFMDNLLPLCSVFDASQRTISWQPSRVRNTYTFFITPKAARHIIQSWNKIHHKLKVQNTPYKNYKTLNNC